ncbi:hypothetical protein COW64_25570 [bacterium (Candidatus Blackallbacteria) CG18_big_fil_WC_8_21_14_2_50_49_26]|nr:MAG: hypothetical protein COW64_25570 [bacterium (Candidatus Blackallbacteria) CG18_big_fil_WC_8_21_14_2_50_49_26]
MVKIFLNFFLFFFVFILNANAKVSRPPNIESAWVEKLVPNRPHGIGDAWWEITYQEGRREMQKKRPQTNQGIQSARYHINDLERGVTSLGTAGSLIKISGHETVTYVYPGFWTGSAWMTEQELKVKAPAVYRKYLILATRQHRTIIALRNELQNKIFLLKQKASLAQLELEQQKPGLKAAEKDYLIRRIKHTQTLIESSEKAIAQPHSVRKVFPTTLVRTYFFEEELKANERQTQALKNDLVQLKKKREEAKTEVQRSELKIQIWQVKQEIALMSEMHSKLEQTFQAFREQDLLLHY